MNTRVALYEYKGGENVNLKDITAQHL